MVHSRPMPSLRTTYQSCGTASRPYCSRASILQVVYRLPTYTPDGSGPMPQAVVLLLRVSRSPRLSHSSGLAGNCEDRLANGKAALVLDTNVGG